MSWARGPRRGAERPEPSRHRTDVASSSTAWILRYTKITRRVRTAELIATRDDRGGLGALAEQSIELLATGTATSATTAYSTVGLSSSAGSSTYSPDNFLNTSDLCGNHPSTSEACFG